MIALESSDTQAALALYIVITGLGFKIVSRPSDSADSLKWKASYMDSHSTYGNVIFNKISFKLKTLAN